MAPRLRLFRASPKLSIPNNFRCPISLDLMKDPVTLSTGITYDRQSIERWLESNTNNLTCPVTNQVLTNSDQLIPNHTIRKMIQDWCVANKSFGIERIPTPRAPVTSTQVSDMLSDMELAIGLRDRVQFLDLVSKIKKLAKESERNRRCIATNGAAKVLALGFKQFARDTEVCVEVLSVMTSVCPIDEEACRRIAGSTEALESIVWTLGSGDLATRLNAVLVVRELAIDQERACILAKTEGLCEAIVKLIKEPISPRSTKASLVTAYYLVSSGQEAITRFVDLGLVYLLLEILVDSEKSVCEKALGVLDGILGSETGRQVACAHALTIPVLVKKMFRVSDIATEFAVSSLWKMCKNCNNDDDEQGKKLAESALSVGAFQKLLLLLQLGCIEGTKEKASETLKMLNGWRGNGECIDSADFKGLKRNF